MRNILLTILLFLGFNTLNQARNDDIGHPSDDPGYPVPIRSEKLLFYVQRTHNHNTVIYELNLQPDGKLNKKEPLHPSWIRYEEGGVRKELSFIQNRVYGLDVHMLDESTFLIHFRSFKKRTIYLIQAEKNNQYKVMISINGKMEELTSIFICSVNNSLGIPSSVKYIDIHGINPATGNIVSERVIP